MTCSNAEMMSGLFLVRPDGVRGGVVFVGAGFFVSTPDALGFEAVDGVLTFSGSNASFMWPLPLDVMLLSSSSSPSLDFCLVTEAVSSADVAVEGTFVIGTSSQTHALV